jgi:filamentous hemagglutinin family protein
MAAKISIVMTTHNRDHYLGSAIVSVLRQTYPNFELLIWDDGSTDRSVETAQSYAIRDPRIRVVAAPHVGRTLALKAAIARTTGDYIGWLDDDDLLSATALEATAAVLDKNSAIGMVYTDYVDINEQGKVLGYGHRCHIPYSPQRLLIDFMTFHFRLIRRTVFEQAGGINSKIELAEDYDLCLRLSEVTQVQHLKQALYYYRQHSNSITQQQMQTVLECSQRAIAQALERRGLADRWTIEVQQQRFILRRRNQPIPFKLAKSVHSVVLSPTTQSITQGSETSVTAVPKISLVIPTYNREHFLGAAIHSVLQQTYSNFELLIWVDGSTDNSLEIAQRYAEHDPRVRVVAAEHGGHALALKNAIAHTTGEYIGWVDDDDLLAATALEKTVAILDAHPDVGLVYTDYVNISESGKFLSYGRLCRIPYSKTRLLVDLITFHFRLIRRSVYYQVGGIDPFFDCAKDYDLCLRLSEVTEVKHIQQPLYYYRHHGNNMSYQRRQDQITYTQIAINRALQRRGLDQQLSAEFCHDRFVLHRKAPLLSIHPSPIALKSAGVLLATLPFVSTTGKQVQAALKGVPNISIGQVTSVEHDRAQSISTPATNRSIATTLATPEVVAPEYSSSSSLRQNEPILLAQAIVPATDGTGTQVLQNNNRFDIMGGQLSQDGANLFHSFEKFGLDPNQIANFLSNPQIHNILGRVVGGNASLINGLIQVTGGNSNLYLMNPAGIVFGANARLDVPGAFTATTASGIGFGSGWFNTIGSNNYASLIGNPTSLAFALNQPGAIVNAGNLAVKPGQSLNLVGGTIANTGELSASSGQVLVSAVPGTSLVRISQPGSPLSLEIEPLGNAAGNIALNPLSLPELLTGQTGQMTGLTAIGNNQVQLNASGVSIPVETGTTILTGSVDVSNPTAGQTGGTVAILGNKVGLFGAQINASGANGGGTVLVGGDYQGKGFVPNATVTYISPDSTIQADAQLNGNGGKIIAWADDTAQIHGTLTTHGGLLSGNGGFVETSGKHYLQVTRTPDLTAPAGSGGTWLIDPSNITIQNTPPVILLTALAAPLPSNPFIAIADDSTIEVGLINSALNSGIDVFISTNNPNGTQLGNITQNADALIIKNTPTTAGRPSLTLNAANDIILNAGIDVTAGGIDINLLANDPEQGGGPTGRIAVNAPIDSGSGSVNLTGTEVILNSDINTQGDNADNTITINSDRVLLGANTTISTSIGSGYGADIDITGRIDGTQNLFINAGTGSVRFGSAIGSTTPLSSLFVFAQGTTIGNNITTANGSIFFNSPVTITGNAIFDAGTASIEFNSSLAVGSNALVLNADEMDFSFGNGIAVSATGGTLVLQPATADLPIAIGGIGYGSDRLDLDQTDLTALQNGGGFASITIGRSNGSGTINVAGDVEFVDPVTIQSPTGTGSINSNIFNITGSGDASIQFIANQNITTGNITTPGGISIFSNSGSINTTNGILSTDASVQLTANQNIITGNITAPGGISIFSSNGSIDTTNGLLLTSSGFGNAGRITLTALGNILTGDLFAPTAIEGTGNGGDVTLTSLAGAIDTSSGQIVTGGFSGNTGFANVSGQVTFSAPGNILTGAISTYASGAGNAGQVRLNSQSGSLTVNDFIDTGSSNGNGGAVILNALNDITILNARSATIYSGSGSLADPDPSLGNGNGGLISLNSAAGNISVLGGLSSTSVNGSGGAMNLSALGNVFTNDLTTSGNIGGDIALISQQGAVVSNNLNTSGRRLGGNIIVNALESIQTEAIISRASIGDGGSVLLDPINDIQVAFIDAQGGSQGRGGTVDITTQRFFRATDTFVDQNDVTASISTAGSRGGGNITIRHGGGGARVPFEVGDASTNGTAGAITNGNQPDGTIAPFRSFPGSHRQDQNRIQILTQDFPAPPENDPVPPLVETGGTAQLPCLDASVAGAESNFTNEYEQYLGSTAGGSNKNLGDTCTTLANVEAETGIRPALVYATFIPASVSDLSSVNADRPDQATDQLELLVVTAQGKPIRKRVEGVTRSQVIEFANEFRREVSDSRKTRTKSYLTSAQQLYQIMIAPLEAELQTRKVENLAFVLDTGLRSLPLAALHDGKQFLIEKYSIGLMPSVNLTDTRYVDVRNAKVLAMGASEFSDLPPLPAVPAELSILNQLWQGEEFLNQNFTREKLQAERRKEPFGIVHLATHGEFQPGEPSNSYIQLWNDRLQLDQLRELGLNSPPAQLLVLSACRTALGDRDAELGFAGLAVQSGAKSALGSLWYVSDVGTLGLMTQFYQQLRQVPLKAEALRQAQIAMLKGKVRFEDGQLQGLGENAINLPPDLAASDSSNLAHPFFWSPFIMIGNPW